MVITYYGHEFFKLQLGDLTVAYNPISKDSKLKGARFGADIVLVAFNHEDFNGIESVTYGDRVPLIITGPGEYESKEVVVRGYLTKTKYGGKDSRNNVIYTATIDGMMLAFLGALDTRELPPDLLETLGEVDILFVPIGGEKVLTSADAAKIASSIEPKLIIPMHYDSLPAGGSLKQFFKETGEDSVKPVDKLTLKKKDLEGKEGEVTVLDSQA